MKKNKFVLALCLLFPFFCFAQTPAFNFYNQNWYGYFNLHINGHIIKAYEYIDTRHKNFSIKNIATDELLLIGSLGRYETIDNKSVITLKPSDFQDYIMQSGPLKPNIDFYIIQVQSFEFNLHGQPVYADGFSLMTP